MKAIFVPILWNWHKRRYRSEHGG